MVLLNRPGNLHLVVYYHQIEVHSHQFEYLINNFQNGIKVQTTIICEYLPTVIPPGPNLSGGAKAKLV